MVYYTEADTVLLLAEETAERTLAAAAAFCVSCPLKQFVGPQRLEKSTKTSARPRGVRLSILSSQVSQRERDEKERERESEGIVSSLWRFDAENARASDEEEDPCCWKSSDHPSLSLSQPTSPSYGLRAIGQNACKNLPVVGPPGTYSHDRSKNRTDVSFVRDCKANAIPTVAEVPE